MITPTVESFSSLMRDWCVHLPPGLIVFLATAGLEGGRYFSEFREEFIGTFLMICCTFSAGKWIGKGSLAGTWGSHAMGVIAADFIGGGPHVNPAVTLAMWSLGKVTYTQGFVRTAGQMAGGLLAFPMFHALSDVLKLESFGGPEFNQPKGAEHAVEAFLSEFCATALLLAAIYALNFEIHFGKYHYIVKQTLTAVAIRALIEFFPTAGPAMNPMLATTWYCFGVDQSFEFPSDYHHYFVYWVAPYLAALLASFLYVVYAGGTFFGKVLPLGPVKKSTLRTKQTTKKIE